MRTLPTTAPRAILYRRVSTDEQAQTGTSLAEQLAVTARKAADMGAAIVDDIADEGISGAYYSARPGLQKAIRLIESGEADTLMVANVSRLSRDREHQTAIQKRVRAAGGRIVFCEQSFDETPEGDLMFGIIGGFAAYEREVIRSRTVKGRQRRAEEGVQVSRSMRPYGYVVPTKADVIAGTYPAELLGKYIQHPGQAPHVAFMFAEYAAGSSLRQIALALHRDGVPTARGGVEWEAETISGILRNPVHKGEPTFGREERVIDESRRERGLKSTYFNRPRPAEQVIRLSAPAIVTPEIWAEANARLDHNKDVLRGRRDRRWLLTGLFRCPHCGLSMKGHSVKQRNPRAQYSCPHYSKAQTARGFVCDPTRYDAEHIEAAVIAGIRQIVNEPESIAAAFAAFSEESDHVTDTDAERVHIESELTALSKRERAAVESQIIALQAGASPETFGSIFGDIRDKRDTLNRRLTALGATKANSTREERQRAAQAIVARLEAVFTELIDAPELTIAEKHELLCRLIRYITIENRANGEGDTLSPILRVELHNNGVSLDSLSVAVICVSSVTRSTPLLSVLPKPY